LRLDRNLDPYQAGHTNREPEGARRAVGGTHLFEMIPKDVTLLDGRRRSVGARHEQIDLPQGALRIIHA
jgi:hypothetical protein